MLYFVDFPVIGSNWGGFGGFFWIDVLINLGWRILDLYFYHIL